MVSTKILNRTIIFNIDNNKKWSRSACYEGFMKDHIALKAEVMVAFKNILLIYFKMQPLVQPLEFEKSFLY